MMSFNENDRPDHGTLYSRVRNIPQLSQYLFTWRVTTATVQQIWISTTTTTATTIAIHIHHWNPQPIHPLPLLMIHSSIATHPRLRIVGQCQTILRSGPCSGEVCNRKRLCRYHVAGLGNFMTAAITLPRIVCVCIVHHVGPFPTCCVDQAWLMSWSTRAEVGSMRCIALQNCSGHGSCIMILNCAHT
jgi:hypothetical protein